MPTLPTGTVTGGMPNTGSWNQSQGTNQAQSASASTSFIPEYSQTPILQGIAQQAQGMAQPIYDWGMQQFTRNQGNIDSMMRAAQSYASPQRVAQEMGQAQAGVQQGAEAGRQNAIRDLESYGIDPSSGRYAALDQASRVTAGAAAAGAGNQQRMATEAAGSAMQNQALSAGMQNVASGYGAAQAANQFLGTGMNLGYSPLGNMSQSSSESWGQQSAAGGSGTNPGLASAYPYNTGQMHYAGGGPVPGVGADNCYRTVGSSNPSATPRMVCVPPGKVQMPSTYNPSGQTNLMDRAAFAEGGDVEPTTGGFVSQELSPSGGSQVDDVQARLNEGEFVIPKDVVQWKGQEFFYKLMAQARKLRATGGDTTGQAPPQTGYQNGNGGEEVPGYAQGGAIPNSIEGPEMYGSTAAYYNELPKVTMGKTAGQLTPEAAWAMYSIPLEEKKRIGLMNMDGTPMYTDFERALMPRVSKPGGGSGSHWTDTTTGTRLIDRYQEGGAVQPTGYAGGGMVGGSVSPIPQDIIAGLQPGAQQYLRDLRDTNTLIQMGFLPPPNNPTWAGPPQYVAWGGGGMGGSMGAAAPPTFRNMLKPWKEINPAYKGPDLPGVS